MEMIAFDSAKHAIVKAASVDEVKSIRDKAEAFRLYVKKIGESLEMQNRCAEIKLRAERRAGELLMETPKAKRHVNSDTLSQLGVERLDGSAYGERVRQQVRDAVAFARGVGH